jgi:exodeoxyribonuclease-1
VLRLVQAASVYAPDSIVVPTADSGKPTRRLDVIAPANGFNQHNAHDALGDVEATIFVARLIKQRAPEIWAALMPLAAKPAVIERALSKEVLSLTDFYNGKPYSWLVVGCGQNPEYDAHLGVFDLRYDPTDYIDMSVERLIEIMNGRAKAIRCIKANAQPILLPRALAGPDLHDLGIDHNEIERRARLILESDDFQPRVGEAISNRYPAEEPSAYVEERMYDGFPTRSDELLMQRFHQVPWEQRGQILDQIGDERVRELGYRLIYIERPSALPDEKREGLDTWLSQRLKPNIEVPWLSVAGASVEVEKLLIEDPENSELFSELAEWLRTLAPLQNAVA